MRLTPDGDRLARRGEEILALLARAEAELTASTSLQAGQVRLAAFPSAAATLVPGGDRAAARAAPGLALDLIEAEPPEAAALLRAGTVDLALTFVLSRTRPSRTASPPWYVHEDPLYLVAAARASTSATSRSTSPGSPAPAG